MLQASSRVPAPWHGHVIVTKSNDWSKKYWWGGPGHVTVIHGNDWLKKAGTRSRDSHRKQRLGPKKLLGAQVTWQSSTVTIWSKPLGPGHQVMLWQSSKAAICSGPRSRDRRRKQRLVKNARLGWRVTHRLVVKHAGPSKCPLTIQQKLAQMTNGGR